MNSRIDSIDKKLTYNISETAEVLGISRPTMYELLHREDFPSFRVGKRVLVPVDALKRWVEEQVRG
ncbi:MAG: helix-turn-helix domain-containing protein [Eubacteriales bacterium]|nr:helix-turn-helix domain-containing protein [Eubacteriales bacterium]